MSGLIARPYQRAAKAAIVGAWRQGKRTPAIVIPTGGGKSFVIGDVVSDPDVQARGRTLVLAHREELITQNADEIRGLNPGMRVGVVMGALDEVGADVVSGSVATLAREARLARLRNVGTVIVDECHHATAASYRTILEHYGVLPGAGRDAGRNAYGLGATATMSRGDLAALGDVWQDVVFRRSIADLIRGEGAGGYLVPPRGITVDVENLELAKVKKTRKGDYDENALGKAMTESLAPARIIEAWQQHADNKATILFAPTVAFAELMCEAFRREGVRAAVVHGEMPKDERRAALLAFKNGEITVLCNCMVLTEGTNLPIAEVAIIARPTCHHGLYVQMVGRVLRLYPGKTSALVLDVAGASKRHSIDAPIDLEGAAGRDLTAKLDGDEDTSDDQITLVDELAGGGGLDLAYKDGALVIEHVDLFHGSKSAWNQTYGGRFFLEVGNRDMTRYLVLVPNWSGEAWHVVEVAKKRGGMTKRGVPGSAYVACDVPDIGYAMSLAEADVTWREQSLASKQSGWRKHEVSQRQLDELRRLALVLPAGGKANEASELIARAHASARLD